MATSLQLEIASKLKELGSQKAVAALGYNKGTVSKIAKKLNKGWKPEEEEETPESESTETANQEHPKPVKQPTVRAGVPTAPIAVGKITITPENWGLTQYGSLLILDTYNRTKRDINYGGTMGEFLCLMCEFYRRILSYKEVEDGRATSEGQGGNEEGDSESVEPGHQLTETK